MNKRKVWYWIIGVFFLLVAGLVIGGLGLFGRLPWQGGDLYQDPQGRYSMQVGPWQQVKTDGRYTQFKLVEPSMNMYLLVLKAGNVNDAFAQAMGSLGFDPGILSGELLTIGDWQASNVEDTAGLNYGLAGQIVGEDAYVALVKADKPGVGIENPPVMSALASFKISAKEEISITNYAELESFVQKQVDRLAGSVSVALVYQDNTVYTYAYGKANPVKGIPADTQTIFAFGSMTKPFTASTLMQLVDQGKVDLDAWPGEYIPEFPKRWNITVRQLVNHSALLTRL